MKCEYECECEKPKTLLCSYLILIGVCYVTDEDGDGMVADYASGSCAVGGGVCGGLGKCVISQAGAANARVVWNCRA